MDPDRPDPNQMSDHEQIMLGAQQAAILQQIQDHEIESKAIQQQHMIQEEQLLEAQHEALALHQHHLLEHEKQAVEMHVLPELEPQQAQQQEGPSHIQHHMRPLAAEPELVIHPPHIPVAQHIAVPESHPTHVTITVAVPTVAAPPPLMAQPHPQPVVFHTTEAAIGPPQVSGPPQQPQLQPAIGLPPPHMIQTVSHPGTITVGAPTPLMSTPLQPPTVTHVSVPFSVQGPPAGAPPPLMAQIQNLPPQRMTLVKHENLGPRPLRMPAEVEEMPHQRLPPSEDIPVQPPPKAKVKEPERPSSDSPGPAQSQAGPPKAPPGPPQQKEIKLPQALEKVLAFKGERAQQVGVKPEDMEKVEKDGIFEEEDVAIKFEAMIHQSRMADLDDEFADEDEDEIIKQPQAKKESKNKKRKKKKKRAKTRKTAEPLKQPLTSIPEENYEIEYIQDDILLDKTDAMNREFSRIFEAFKITGTDDKGDVTDISDASKDKQKLEDVPIKARGLIDDDDDDDDEDQQQEDDDKPRLSKKKQKKLNRLSVAELKQLVLRPDVVEMHDVTARDPKLLVHLKATRNTVTVPRHWCFKRKYLQGKRGIEKPPFDLPEFIKATGIMEMRQALQEKEDQKTMKSKKKKVPTATLS